jgi:hypothetical protein
MSKCNRNAFRLRRKAFVIRSLFGCGGSICNQSDTLTCATHSLRLRPCSGGLISGVEAGLAVMVLWYHFEGDHHGSEAGFDPGVGLHV